MPRSVADAGFEQARRRLIHGQLRAFVRLYAAAAALILITGLVSGDAEAILLSAANLVLAPALYLLLRRRRLALGAGLLCLLTLATAVWATWTNPYGLLDATVVVFVAVVVLASLLLKGLGLGLVVGLTVTSATVVGLRRPLGLVGDAAADPTLPLDVVLIVLVLLLCTVWIRRQDRFLQDSLRRSLHQERQLEQQHKDLQLRAHRLARSERRWRSLVQAAPDWVLQVEGDGTVIYANRPGLAADGQVVGRRLVDLASDGEADAVERALARIAAGTGGAVVEARLDTEEGPRRCLLHFGSLEGEGASGAIVLVNDETERRNLRDQLERAQRLDSLGRLAGGIAHDFKNLLTVIQGHVDLAEAAVENNADPRPDLERARQACVRAGQLSQRILTFGRRETNLARRVDVNAVLEAHVGMLQRLLGDDVDLVVDLAGGLPPVEIDPGHLEQVVMNLVLNARDALGEAPRRIRLTTGSREGGVEVAVADTGAGMDESVQRRIFEPFFTTKAQGAGTGLGLAVVHGIVAQCGGRIEVRSRPGNGTTVRVLLPAAVEGEARRGAAGA
jgi:signal transduction histidine kinase